MSANNKQTNKGGACAGVVWNCAVTEFSVQCIRVHGKASEMYRRYIGKGMKVGRRSYSDNDTIITNQESHHREDFGWKPEQLVL